MNRELMPGHGRQLRMRGRLRDPFERMRQNMEHLFSDRFEGLPASWFAGADDNAFRADLDIGETPEDLKITLDVPGIDLKDIDIALSDHALVVRGLREERDEEKKEDYHRVERSFGAFERRVTLPCDVDSDKATADLEKGVLTITLPKSQHAKDSERKIEIKAR